MISLDQLVKIPLLADLSEEHLAHLREHLTIRTYRKHSIIISEGDSSDYLYLIVTGKARVYCSDEEGREIILNDLVAGDHFGELALFDKKERSASIVATDNCKLILLDRSSLLDVFHKSPDLALQLVGSLALRVRDLTSQVKNLALNDVYGRVANTLLSLTEDVDGERITRVPLTQQDIANRIGASREMVSRIMKDLVVGGYIRSDKKKIIIEKELPAHY